MRGFATSEWRARQSPQRHGKAVEPYPIGDGVGSGTDNPNVLTSGEGDKDDRMTREYKRNEENSARGKEEKHSNSASGSHAEEPPPDKTQSNANDTKLESEAMTEPARATAPAENTSSPLAPLETVLQMPPPATQDQENAAKPPHLQTPPYVHHFDTYTLVQQVEAGDFTTEQSITAMKAVRGLLAHNLDVAKAGLVSKSDVENVRLLHAVCHLMLINIVQESYLFRAACSELRTEIQNQRKATEETMRRERTLLQHEVDTLNQKLTQELLALKDDLKGMFDDRKMAVRMEQRAMESKVRMFCGNCKD